MSQSGDRRSDDVERDVPASPADRNNATNPPLVIVSEQGRHSYASRRIVRAQAARASAAQSRVTRARNRGQRQTGMRESDLTPPPPPPPPPPARQSRSNSPYAGTFSVISPVQEGRTDRRVNAVSPRPLNMWLSDLIHQPVPIVVNHDSSFRLPNVPTRLITDGSSLQLPHALPRGFVGLQHRIEISETMLTLMSRSACVDFASPGFEQRLHQLLFDLITTPSRVNGSTEPRYGHPIEDHFRLASTCLTIFQGQRTMNNVSENHARYQDGLQAAWAEAVALDPQPLTEPLLAEVSLWIVIVISVTTARAAGVFRTVLRDLLRDLQLTHWEQTRRILLDFIYPVSILDEACQTFYQNFSRIEARPP